MIPCPTGKRTTWKAPKLLPSRNQKAVQEKKDSLDTVKSTNVLQCPLPCADMWHETTRHTDRQTGRPEGRQCMQTYRSCRDERVVESDQDT